MVNYNLIITLLGVAMLGACLGLVGAWAVLRRNALAGDVVAHCALPGLCLGFLVLGTRNLFLMLTGATLSGALGLALSALLVRHGRVRQDAAMGLVLSVFFGVGTVLRSIVQSRVEEGAKAGLEAFLFGQSAGMQRRDLMLLAGLTAVCLLLSFLFHKELKLTSFDGEYAQVLGYANAWIDALVLTLLAVTIALALPLVGVVLVAAMLILPSATIRLWTADLRTLLFAASLLGATTGIGGVILSSTQEGLPAGPVTVLCGGVFFCFSLAFAPQNGLIAKARELQEFRRDLARAGVLQAAQAGHAVPPRLRGAAEDLLRGGLVTGNWPLLQIAKPGLSELSVVQEKWGMSIDGASKVQGNSA